MAKQKIVFLHPDLGIGGAERLVLNAAMELSRLGYEARVISGRPQSLTYQLRGPTARTRLSCTQRSMMSRGALKRHWVQVPELLGYEFTEAGYQDRYVDYSTLRWRIFALCGVRHVSFWSRKMFPLYSSTK